MYLCYHKPCSLHTVIVFYDFVPTVTIPLSNVQWWLMFPSSAPHQERFGLEQYCHWDNSDKPVAHWAYTHSATHSHSLTHTLALSLPDMGVSQMVLFIGAGLALLQTIGVAGLATQITDGLIEAVRQHGQLATVTQRAGSGAWTTTMLAAVSLLETEKTH